MESNSVRIDKFLWAVRLFKTRSQAAEACKKGRVLMNNIPVKPSREIKTADIFELKKSPVLYKYKVKEILTNRVGAKLVENYLENITPQEELFKLEVEKNMPYFKRDRGTGRPTKKDRRDIDRLYDI
jgi:ribosome-associated heat shock protein Hsp15